MNDNLKKLIEQSQAEADEIIKSTAGIRKAFVVGRPNTSQESTVGGTLEAFSIIVSAFDIGLKTQK